MRIVEQTHERLVVEAGDVGFASLLLVASIGCAVAAALLYVGRIPGAGRDALPGTISGAVIFLIGFLALFERARFEFNRSMGQLIWRRRRAFTTRSGMISFSRIETVIASKGLGSTAKAPKWRVVVVLPEEELPLSTSFAPDPSGTLRGLAETIRRFIG